MTTADFYLNEDGLMVFTEAYHLKRGYCCKNKCRHCPWKFGQAVVKDKIVNKPPAKSR